MRCRDGNRALHCLERAASLAAVPERGEQQPEPSAATFHAPARRCPAAVQHMIEDIVGCLPASAGFERSGPRLRNRARLQSPRYDVARAIPAGKQRSHGSRRAPRRPKLARDVAQALKQNPPIIVPCHRVMAAGGKTGGWRRAAYAPSSASCRSRGRSPAVRRCLPISRSRRDRGGALDPDHTLSIDACPDVM
jgi:O6-methylguanine-DNA--protein-cysteine methyltransferase